MESVAELEWNGWPDNFGMGGRITSESPTVATLYPNEAYKLT